MDRETITELIARISSGITSDQACSRMRVIVLHLVEIAGDPGDDYIRQAATVLGGIGHPSDGSAALATAFRRSEQ